MMEAIFPGNSIENEVTMTQELRFLPVCAVSKLSVILEEEPGWKEIMGYIPSNPWKPGEPIPEGGHYAKKYSYTDIKTVTEECRRCDRRGFEVLLEEWGTSGRKRPTVQDLVFLLQKTKLYRASDYLTVTLMNGDPLPRDSSNNPEEELRQAIERERCHENVVFGTYAVKVQDTPTSGAEAVNIGNFDQESTRLIELKAEPTAQIETSHYNDPKILQGMDCSNVLHFSYSGLKLMTNNFSDVLISEGGNKLGEGAFGKVYYAKVFQEGREKEVAIKRFLPINDPESKLEKQFKTEIEILSGCSHENLVPLEGYSCDGPEWCLVYAFMTNGSLYDCLACDSGREKLNWKTRIRIGEGSARGIVYLHTFEERPRVHRDIKSANILLDENLIPKVGDFGLVHLGGMGNNKHTIVKTTTAFGTAAYMASEAFRGDVSVKLDTFSFGVVLLELLTGLPASDDDRNEPHLMDHVMVTWNPEEGVGIDCLLDTKAGNWNTQIFTELLELAITCCRDSKKERPSMVEVLEKYSAIAQSVL